MTSKDLKQTMVVADKGQLCSVHNRPPPAPQITIDAPGNLLLLLQVQLLLFTDLSL